MVEIELNCVGRTFFVGEREVRALRDVSLHIPAGSLSAVVGHSGCGKTTLLRVIAGIERVDSGFVSFSGARPRIGMVFQEPRLLPWKSVRANLQLAVRDLPATAQAQAISSALELVGLRDWGAAMPGELSGGMAQRIGLARALCRNPEVLLLDEPFGALDALTRSQMHAELQRIRSERAFTAVLVTHDVGEATLLADRIAHLHQGRLVGCIEVGLPHPRAIGDPRLGPLVAATLRAVLSPH